MHPIPLRWNRGETPAGLHSALETLAENYPIREDGEGRLMRFVSSKAPGSLLVQSTQDAIEISHGSIAAALRGVGLAMSGQQGLGQSTFRTLGVMLDCSRNAVMKVDCVKRWLRQLALLGYDMLMLYTEDTYELPQEPFFGYMRGAYTKEEVREIDAYAARLGISVIACIQTLGHLGQILKWDRYKGVSDTSGVLLVDEEATYALIAKMLAFWSEALGSRRIHLGMDEAHDLGRGKFLDRNGYEPPFDIFNRHLAKVCGMAEHLGLSPMIWSDMYFRMGNPRHDYYGRDTIIPDHVKAKIPKTVDLVYWDYYSTDEGFYREWIRRHRDLGHPPVMASGIWTWARFWYDHARTKAAAAPCVRACRTEGVEEMIFTLWGDGGSYAEFDSAFAGLAWAADLSFGGTGTDADVAPVLGAVCGGDYGLVLAGTGLQVNLGEGLPEVNASTILWDDPLLGIGWQGYLAAASGFWTKVIEKLCEVQTRAESAAGERPCIGYLQCLCRVLIGKLKFQEALVPAYENRDAGVLRRLKDEDIPVILAALADLETVFRRQWLDRNKPFGMEVVQIRFGALSVRYRETAIRIDELLAGRIASIEELDARRDDLEVNEVKFFDWLATGSLVI